MESFRLFLDKGVGNSGNRKGIVGKYVDINNVWFCVFGKINFSNK